MKLKVSAVIAAVLLQGCGDGTGSAPIATIELIPAVDTLISIGQTRQLSAVARDADENIISGVAFVWSSSNTSVATVTPSGVVTAAAGGFSGISATASRVVGYGTLVVQPMAQVGFLTQPGVLHGLLPHGVQVAVQDENGATVTRADVEITIALGANTSGAKLVGDTTARAVHGIATFTVAVDRPGDAFVLEARSSGLESGSTSPFRVILRFLSVTTGTAHSCGITTLGFGYCWGQGGAKMGMGSGQDNQLRPVPIAGNLRFLQLSASVDNTCGVATDNKPYCWGDDGQGQLGNGSTNATMAVPSPVATSTPFNAVTQLSAGTLHACGVSSNGFVACWGNNQHGELGDNVGMFRDVPHLVASGGVRFLQVSAGYTHTCALSTDSLAYCWGDNFYGQVGDSTRTGRLAPTPVYGGLKFRSISAGMLHSCAVTPADVAYCWGWGGDGAVGDDSAALRAIPSAVAGGLSFDQVNAGTKNSCGVTTGDVAYCWGENSTGAVGDSGNAPRFRPTLVTGGFTWLQATTGGGHSCGVTTTNEMYCWGRNLFGELGDGTTSDRYAPTRVVQ